MAKLSGWVVVSAFMAIGCSAPASPGDAILDVDGDRMKMTNNECFVDIGVTDEFDIHWDNYDVRDANLSSPLSTGYLSFSMSAPREAGPIELIDLAPHLTYDAAPTEREDNSIVKWYWPKADDASHGITLRVDAFAGRDHLTDRESIHLTGHVDIQSTQTLYPAGLADRMPVTLPPQIIPIDCTGTVGKSVN